MSLVLLFNTSLSDTGATGQNVLDLMELLNQELQLQPGEVDVTRALLALNAAQDFFESLASQHPDILGSQVGEFTTVAATETITYPLGLLRLDRVILMKDATTAYWELKRPNKSGGHLLSNTWPWNVINTTGSGKPYIYWTNGRTVYFNPIPDAEYTLRWHGFVAQDNITADGSFMYPDICMLPLATFATRLMKSGVDDSTQDLVQLATDTFNPVIDSMSNFNRDGAFPLIYTQIHEA